MRLGSYNKGMNNNSGRGVIKMGFIIAILIFIFVIFRKLGKNLLDLIDSLFGKKQQVVDEKKEKEREQAIKDSIDWSNISYSKSQYNAFCETIWTGLYGNPLTEDERVVWSVFKKMKTNDDVKCLKLYYGRRKAGTLLFPKQSTLSESLAEVFTANELNTCNYLLKRNGLQERV
jgi:hypothetical protein